MNIISVPFLLINLIVIAVYWKLPEVKQKNRLLLIANILFVLSYGMSSTIFLVSVILLTWFAGKYIGKGKGLTYGKIILSTVVIVVLVCALAVVKYSGLSIQAVGISFYTFQAISYIVDIYRGDVKEEKSILIYAIYISFFPQILAGPIVKAKVQLDRYKRDRLIEEEAIISNLLIVGWGVFLKLVIADRIKIFVDNVYQNALEASNSIIILAVFLYSIQIYCDFAGYSLIAIGTGKLYGITLPRNFRQPYLSTSVTDFWKRWHISLTDWFRDYLYFPLGGNRKGNIRTYLNIMMVFLVSGIWHGVGVTFVIWGALHGFLQVAERAWNRVRRNRYVMEHTEPEKKCWIQKFVKILVTYILVSILWIFFRADSIEQVFNIFNGISSNPGSLHNITLYGLNRPNWGVLLVGGVIMLIGEVLAEHEINVTSKVMRYKLPIRWAIYYGLILGILIFGVYGPEYDASNFIYFKF